MSAQVEQLEAAITALDTLDLDMLDDKSLHEITVGLQRAGQRLSLAAGRCRARRLGEVPATAVAVAEGRLSIDHVDLLARAQRVAPERFAADEELLVGQCAGLRFPQAEQVVAYWRLHADPDGTKPADTDRHELHASTLEDGTVAVNGTLDVLGGEVFQNELDRLELRQRLTDRNDGVVRTVGQRRVAALLEMATRSAAMPPGARRPRPLLVVHVGDDTGRGLCQTAAGRILHPDALTPTSMTPTWTSCCSTGPPGETSPWNGRLECSFHNRHSDRHDTDAQPLEPRDITIFDEIRGRLRWLNLQHERTHPDEEGDDEADDEAAS